MNTIQLIKNQLLEFTDLPLENMSDELDMASLKMDSLNMLDFHMKLEDTFNIEIDIDKFLECKNIKDIDLLMRFYMKNESR